MMRAATQGCQIGIPGSPIVFPYLVGQLGEITSHPLPPLHQMRIQQLEYATAVARFGSFRRAAENLHISQPALSENVRRLERELGVEILDRRRSGATVGEYGRELLPH